MKIPYGPATVMRSLLAFATELILGKALIGDESKSGYFAYIFKFKVYGDIGFNLRLFILILLKLNLILLDKVFYNP
ncbi:hypothetical protein TR13x_04155 [Caloranaerobacter sp. TR13]|nr:hypothetical protein TR13x_04155 [Caloranaerobacter sp. TR13]